MRCAPGVTVSVASLPSGALSSAAIAVVGPVRMTTPFFVVPSDGVETGLSVYSALPSEARQPKSGSSSQPSFHLFQAMYSGAWPRMLPIRSQPPTHRCVAPVPEPL